MGGNAPLPPDLHHHSDGVMADLSVLNTHENIIHPTNDLNLHQQEPFPLMDYDVVTLQVDAPIYQMPVSKEGIAAMDLYELCNNANTPHGFYDDLLKLLKQQSQQNVDISHLPS